MEGVAACGQDVAVVIPAEVGEGMLGAVGGPLGGSGRG